MIRPSLRVSFEHLDHSLLVVIDELGWIEVCCLALENMLGKFKHVRLNLHLGDVAEILPRISDDESGE